MRLLNIISSPRGPQSASIAIASAFTETLLSARPETTVDTLNVWEEDLPEFDAQAIGAKYKGVSGEDMDPREAQVWTSIKQLAGRFQAADSIVLGTPMWNFSIPYKLKQLIDLVAQRNMLFTYAGREFGPLLKVERALVIYTRGQTYEENGFTPASRFDHQSDYLEFWLRLIGVKDVRALAVENCWGPHFEQAVAEGKRKVREFALHF